MLTGPTGYDRRLFHFGASELNLISLKMDRENRPIKTVGGSDKYRRANSLEVNQEDTGKNAAMNRSVCTGALGTLGHTVTC